MLDQLRAGDVIVIWKLDRMGRSLKHLVDLVGDLVAKDVGLVSLSDPIDTTTAQGRLVFNTDICGTVASRSGPTKSPSPPPPEIAQRSVGIETTAHRVYHFDEWRIMHRAAAQVAIRKLAPFHDKVRLTDHAKVRDPGKGKMPLTKMEIMACLEHGSVVEGPYADMKMAGGWVFTVERFVDDRKCRVAGVLVPEQFILVITGFSVEQAKRRPPRPASDDGDEEDDGDDDVPVH